MKDRTSLIIAHRLATVKNVDRIVVLDAGNLVAQGTHLDLMQSCELYANFANLQFNESALDPQAVPEPAALLHH